MELGFDTRREAQAQNCKVRRGKQAKGAYPSLIPFEHG